MPLPGAFPTICFNHLRKKKKLSAEYASRTYLSELVASEENTEEDYLQKEQTALLRRELALMSGNYRKAVILHYFDGLSCEEIGGAKTSEIYTVGKYGFASTRFSGLKVTRLARIGEGAFANCAKLSNITILGQPTVGTKPLRRAGTGVGGVTVHLDPALASDNAYMNALKQECLNVTVRADAVVKRMKLSSLSMARNFIVLSVSVEKAAAWGEVDLSAIKVAYRKTLSDEPLMLTPSAIVENPDGSLSVEVPVPAGDSGFFQVVFQK
mgnify:CR=1 FL=1